MACRYWHLCVDVWGHIQDIPESDHLDSPTDSDVCSHLLHGIQPIHSSVCPFTFCHSFHFNMEDDDNGYWGAWLRWHFSTVHCWFHIRCSEHPFPCHLLHNVGHLSHSYASLIHKLAGELDIAIICIYHKLGISWCLKMCNFFLNVSLMIEDNHEGPIKKFPIYCSP